MTHSGLSLAFDSVNALDDVIESLGLGYQELPRPALFLPGRAFVRYRREGSSRGKVLPDFFIGTQAAVLSCAILARDDRHYRNYFARVALVTPDPA